MSVIGILYPGDMGGAVAALLSGAGHDVVTALQGRSATTAEIAKRADVRDLGSLEAVAEVADLVLSIVPPDAVLPVVQGYAGAARPGGAPFVDLNAKTFEQLAEMGPLLAEAGIAFVNGCIIGQAERMRDGGRIYLSGAARPEVAEVFSGSLPVFHLGSDIERATAFKMAFAAFNKCISAVLFETAMAAHGMGVFEPLMAEIEEMLPGTVADFKPLILSYPRHAARRATEMEAVTAMLGSRDLPCRIPAAASAIFAELADDLEFSRPDPGADMRSVLRGLASHR